MVSAMKKRLSDSSIDKEGNESKATYGTFYKYDNLNASMNMSSGDLINDSEEEIEYDREHLRGDKVTVDKAYVIRNFDYIVKTALDFKFTKGQIVKPYNEVKKVFNEEIKKAKSGNVDKEELSSIKAKITNLNKIASAIVFAFYERQRLALGILTKVAVKTLGNSKKAVEKQKAKVADKAAATEANAKEQSTEESAVVVESYTTEIEKLFDWNF